MHRPRFAAIHERMGYPGPEAARRGWSLVELMVVLTVIGILLALSAPPYRRSLEQARADLAAANLRAIWAAQRLYWLDQHHYAGSFADLQPLLDPTVAAGTPYYTYAVVSADETTFTVSATRTGSTVWTGTLVIDQTGQLTGTIQGSSTITPGFQ